MSKPSTPRKPNGRKKEVQRSYLSCAWRIIMGSELCSTSRNRARCTNGSQDSMAREEGKKPPSLPLVCLLLPVYLGPVPCINPRCASLIYFLEPVALPYRQ